MSVFSDHSCSEFSIETEVVTKRAQRVGIDSVPIAYLGLQLAWPAMQSIREYCHPFVASLWSAVESTGERLWFCPLRWTLKKQNDI